MEIITSPDNNQIKAIAKLKDRKYRQKLNKFIIEGYRNVKDSLPYIKNYTVVLSEDAAEKFAAEFPGSLVCTNRVFEKISDTSSSQGVLAVTEIDCKPLDYTKNLIFLDRLSDPGNIGTIMRTCVATEYDNVVNYCGADVYGPKTVRSAMSAAVKLNISQTDDLSLLAELKSKGYTILCADMDGESVFDAQLYAEKICLVIGNEANGICDEVMSYADKVISLPMGRVESLNAAVCASVLMYTLKFSK